MLQQADDAEWERVRTEPRPIHSHPHARGIGTRRLQLVVMPSFEEPSIWELWVRPSREWQLVRPRVVQSEPPVLLVGNDALPFSSSAVAAYFERVVSLHLPLRPDLSGCGGADGTYYELTVCGDLSSGWQFHWWSHWPEQWKPLVELADEMHAAFLTASGSEGR